MSRIKFNGRAAICLILMALSLAAFFIARSWPPQTALFPMFIGAAIFLLSIPALIMILTEKGGSPGKNAGLDRELSDEIEPATARKRAWGAFGWVLGFFLLIILLGFPLATVLFVFSYTRFQGKESWWISLAVTFLCWLFIWGLFIRLLHIPFQEGLLREGLRLMGFT